MSQKKNTNVHALMCIRIPTHKCLVETDDEKDSGAIPQQFYVNVVGGWANWLEWLWKCAAESPPAPPSPPEAGWLGKRVGNQGGGENPNGIMESYHFLTGEDLYSTAKANGLK